MRFPSRFREIRFPTRFWLKRLETRFSKWYNIWGVIRTLYMSLSPLSILLILIDFLGNPNNSVGYCLDANPSNAKWVSTNCYTNMPFVCELSTSNSPPPTTICPNSSWVYAPLFKKCYLPVRNPVVKHPTTLVFRSKKMLFGRVHKPLANLWDLI